MNTSSPPKCSNEQCSYPETGCDMGCPDPDDCDLFHSEDGTKVSLDSPKHSAFPWTGRPFGLRDAHYVSGRRKPLTIGVFGPSDAGKTTLLAMLYLMVLHGIEVCKGRRFSGSYTLEGWEQISRRLQFKPGSPIQYPPHTTSQESRIPGLLHFSFADRGLHKQHALFADAPGEWFANWTRNANGADAQGARWIAEHADKCLLVADSGALTGTDAGPARQTLEFLVSRLASAVNPGQVALIWTKTDIERSPLLIQSVEAHFKSRFPDSPIFSVHVPLKAEGANALGNTEDLQKVYLWALERPIGLAVIPKMRKPTAEDPFLAFRFNDEACI